MNTNRTKPHRLTLAFISLFMISMALASDGTDGVHSALQADNLAIVAAGEVIYQAQCASCHGAQLEGQPNWQTKNEQGFLPAPPHDKTGHTWHHADDLLFEITKYGPSIVIGDPSYQSMMPAFQSILTDEDIISILSYIKNSWPEEERAWQEEINGDQSGGFIPQSKKTTILDKLFK